MQPIPNVTNIGSTDGDTGGGTMADGGSEDGIGGTGEGGHQEEEGGDPAVLKNVKVSGMNERFIMVIVLSIGRPKIIK